VRQLLKERCRNDCVGRRELIERREANETDCVCHRIDGLRRRLRDHAAADADLPRRDPGSRRRALSAASAAAADGLSERHDGSCWNGLPGSAAAAAPAAATASAADPRGRTRLKF